MVESVEIFGLGNARVAFTQRHGGTSAAPYDSLNIANHVGDNDGDVVRNRELVRNAISKHEQISSHSQWSFLNQTHEDKLVLIDENTVIDNAQPPTADASVTRLKDQALVVMTADCGPLVIAGQSIVSVIHASWKTVSAGLIDSVVTELEYLSPGETFRAILGPCIHPQNYEFDEELLDVLAKKLGSHIISKTNDGKPAFNLPEAIKHECVTRNIKFDSVGVDTFSSKNHYSYRRDGVTGRQGVIAWLK